MSSVFLSPHTLSSPSPTNGRQKAVRLQRPPFPDLRRRLGREEICQGRAGFARLATLDIFPPFPKMGTKGKGAGGLRGFTPWRSMRQRLMRAQRAIADLAWLARPASFGFHSAD